MNPNIEVITPVLWAVNSQWVKAGWISELSPVADHGESVNQYASLTNDGIMILKKESDFYPILKQIIPKIMQHTDQELQLCNQTMNEKLALNEYERLYLNVMEWEIQRRNVRRAYLRDHPKTIRERIRNFLMKVGEKRGNHKNSD